MAEASAFFPRSCDGGSSLSIASPVGAADRREGDGSSKGRRCQRPLDKRRCRREMAAATCGICLEAVNEQGVLQRRRDTGMLEQACAHAFCFICVMTWAERTNTCPMCKARFNAVHRAPQKTARGLGETVEVEDRDPTADNNSGDEDLAAELAEQEGSINGESDLDDDDDDPNLLATQHELHGYVLNDFVVDDDEVEVDTEDDDEEWEEWRKPAAAAQLEPRRQPRRAVAVAAAAAATAAAIGSRRTPRTTSWFSTARRSPPCRLGRPRAFGTDMNEHVEEVFFSPGNSFQRRPTYRGRAATAAAVAASERIGAAAGGRLRRGPETEGRSASSPSEVVEVDDDVLPDELRQLQREAARVLGKSPLRPRRRPPPGSRLPATTGATSTRPTRSTSASTSAASPFSLSWGQRSASSDNGVLGDVGNRRGDSNEPSRLGREQGLLVDLVRASSPCHQRQRRRPVLRSLANARAPLRSILGGRGNTITADDVSCCSQEEDEGTSCALGEIDCSNPVAAGAASPVCGRVEDPPTAAAATTLFARGSSYRSAGAHGLAELNQGSTGGTEASSSSLPAQSVPRRHLSAIGRGGARAGAGAGNSSGGSGFVSGQWIPRRVHGEEHRKTTTTASRAGTALTRPRGQEQQQSASASLTRTTTHRTGITGCDKSASSSGTTLFPRQCDGSSDDAYSTDGFVTERTSVSISQGGRRAIVDATVGRGGVRGRSVHECATSRLVKESAQGSGGDGTGCGIVGFDDSDDDEEWMAQSPSVKLVVQRSERIQPGERERTARAKRGRDGKADVKDADKKRLQRRRFRGDSGDSDDDDEEGEMEFKWQEEKTLSISSESDAREGTEFEEVDGEQTTPPVSPCVPLRTRLLQRQQERDRTAAGKPRYVGSSSSFSSSAAARPTLPVSTWLQQFCFTGSATAATSP